MEKLKYGQRGIIKTRERVGENSLNLAEIEELLNKNGVDTEVIEIFLPVPLITVDGVNHGVTIPENLKFKDEKEGE